MTTCHLPTDGTFEFNWTEYYWNTGETVELSGELSVSETETTTGGMPEYCWCWSYTVEGEFETAIGSTWGEFIKSLESLTLLSIDVDSFVEKIHRLLGTAEYEAALKKSYKNFDAKEKVARERNAQKAELEAKKALHKWREHKATKNLVSYGYHLENPNGLKSVESLALEKVDLDALECLIQLDHRPITRSWWESVISYRDETKVSRLAKLLDVNEQFRKHRWHKVYDAEYPLTLVIKSGWQEGLDQLLEIGVNTQQLMSKGGREVQYYDLYDLCSSHGIDPSSINE